jgi:site-specific DNA-methyltransferase (adenine-specific)
MAADNPDCRVIHGEALAVLKTLPDGSVDAVVTDPPYSSGGLFRGDRTAATDDKYTQSESRGRRPDFGGDNRDQRSWAYWCQLWLSECLRVVRPGGYLLTFTDWRQLPTMTDAVQAGGWVWRGVISWDKGEGARAAARHYFRHQCEYVVWGTSGLGSREFGPDEKGCWPGSHTIPVRQDDKHHQAGKPTELLQRLVQCVPPGGTVLDPFAGSFTTGVACVLEGRRFIGVEQEGTHVEVGRRRIAEATRTVPPSGLFAHLADP